MLNLNTRMNTKEKILFSALSLIDFKPFPQISTKEIAKNAGISEGAIFRHFKNKNEILEQLCQHFLNIVTHLNLESIKNEPQFKKNLIDFFLSLQQTKTQIYKLVLYISMYKPEQFKIFNKIIKDKVYKQIENTIKKNQIKWSYKKNINIKIHVRLLMYSIYFFTIQQDVFGADKIEKFDMKNVIETSVNNFIYGLKK